MELSYRNFADSVLSDLLIRNDEKKKVTSGRHRKRSSDQGDPIRFTGNHTCVQYLPPVRLPGENDRDFAARTLNFLKRLPRHSDFSVRNALAFRAHMLEGDKSYDAAFRVHEKLGELPPKMKAEYERAGIGYAFRPIDSPIGSTRRDRRTKEKKLDITAEERRVHTIRAQAYRFIREHEDFDAYFRRNFDSFRQVSCRDEEWYASAERSAIERVEAFEKLREPFDWYAAMPVSAAAQSYHQQSKFEQALFYYRKAIRAAHRAIMHEDFRAIVLDWLQAEAERCQRSEQIGPAPLYWGPWLPIANSAKVQPPI
jgi:tetratricopeptide (TPR) repeat protein